MKNLLLLFLLGCIGAAVVACQQQPGNDEWLRRADEQVYKNVDSLKRCLERVKRPLELKGDERLLYGWLMGYQHYQKDASMVEDSLVVPAADAYINSPDTMRKFMSYQLKADYLKWTGKPHEALAVLDEGTRLAEQRKDTFWMTDLMVRAGRIHCFVLKDYPTCTNLFRKIMAMKETPGFCYSLGLSMAFEKKDSFVYYMSRAADLSLMEKDTTKAIFILRNMASASTFTGQSKKFLVETARRIFELIETNHQEPIYESRRNTLFFSYEAIIDGYLHLKRLDSAQYYLNKYWETKFDYLPMINTMVTFQALIDYTRKGSFDISKAFHFNDSIYRTFADHRKTNRQFSASNKQLTADALELMVERQKTQMSLMFALLMVMALAIGIIVVIGLYRRKLNKVKRQVRGYILLQQENERLIGHNERIIRELKYQIVTEEEQAQEQLEEQKEALAALQRQTEELRKENVGLQQRIEKYRHQPSEEEIRKLRESADRMHRLEERERELTDELANNNDLMRKLREKPKFLESAEWKKLEDITNRVYHRFTERLKAQYGHLTEVDIQLCILLKLRFTVSQISILTATSSSSVSVQKNRLKKRLLQKDEHLFKEGQTLDMYLWMY